MAGTAVSTTTATMPVTGSGPTQLEHRPGDATDDSGNCRDGHVVRRVEDPLRDQLGEQARSARGETE